MALKDHIWGYNPLWGDWYLQRRLSQSHEGHIYLATRESAGRTMHAAVKWIAFESVGEDIDALDFCLKEAHHLYDLRDCPNVVRYEDHLVFKRSDGRGYDVFIRMEYLNPLKLWIVDHGITLSQILEVGSSMVSALEACEARGIVHRDIKIDNIFVTAQGRFKLGDFGIATSELDLKGTRLRGGSPIYLAPEVIAGSACTLKSDQFALGKALFFLLLGAEKSADLSDLDDLEFKMDGAQGLKAWLSVCMAARPKDRFATLGQMKASLEDIRDQIHSDGERWSAVPWGKNTMKSVPSSQKTPHEKWVEGDASKGRIHAFWSPFPSGKTTLAANLAYAYASKHPNRKVALIDFDFKQKTLFFHFPIHFEHLSPAPKIKAYGRYRRLLDAIAHGRFDGDFDSKAYRFKNLTVFTGHRDIALEIAPEASRAFLHLVLQHYDEVVLDLPSESDSLLTQYVQALTKTRVYFVLSPDLEYLNGLSSDCSKVQSWLEQGATLVVNKDIGFNQSHYLSFLESCSSQFTQVRIVPERYRDALRAKYHGAMLYDFSPDFKEAINKLMEV